jgi:hypothetical protein
MSFASFVTSVSSIITKNLKMKFNIYGRFQVDVQREGDAWVVYRTELGKRTPLNDIVIPPDVMAYELATFLDDIFHEFSKLGETIDVMPD